MLDLKFIRENSDIVRQNIINKNEKTNIENLIELDEKRRLNISEAQDLKNQRNVVSKEIAELKKAKLESDDKIKAMKEVSGKIKALDDELSKIEQNIQDIQLYIPNMAHPSVPFGKTAEDNKEIRTWGTPKEQTVKMDHIEIAKQFGIIDFERAAKISGSGFAVYTGKGAKLERALLNFFLDFHTMKSGYEEVMTPFIVNRKSMIGTGQIPKLEEDMYRIENDDFYLIPTAEVPITNLHSKEIFKSGELPKKYCGYSPCFRREAGSYGKDTKGLLRVHQFNKVELVKYVEPEKSYNELEGLVMDVESVLQALELPYRVILLCTGDTSFASAMTYDIEVWSPAEKKWLEVSSCSNFESFQARRANIRYKPNHDSKPVFVHTLNGSGLATPRIMIAILENYIKGSNSILIPEVLREYCKFDNIEK
ncbi:serine--tRNA ligase [Bacteroidota bacterium]